MIVLGETSFFKITSENWGVLGERLIRYSIKMIFDLEIRKSRQCIYWNLTKLTWKTTFSK